MMKNITRIISIILTAVCLISIVPLSVSASYNVDSTYVMDDLEKLSDFNLEEYTKNENEEYVSLIAFHEYGYDYNKNFNDYGLYVYLYNPSGKEFSRLGNYISLMCGSRYRAFSLTYVSSSVKVGYEHVFYKFKVNVDAEFVKSLSSSKRVYDIESITLSYKDSSLSKKFDNNYRYCYTGYDSYHGVDRNSNKSTLECQTNLEETVSLELHGASWKTDTSDKGVNHQYEISSVYFAVPNYFLKKYGSEEDLYKGLYGLTAVWNEFKTNGLITNNLTLFNDSIVFENYIDSKLDMNDKSVPFAFHVKHGKSDNDRCSFNIWALDSIHDDTATGNSLLYQPYNYKINAIPKLCNVIYKSYDEFKGLSSAETAAELLNSDHSVNAFSFVDDGRTYGYNKHYFSVSDGPLNDQIKTFAQTHNDFWTWLAGYGELNKDKGVQSSLDVFHKVVDSDFVEDHNINANALFMCYEDYIGLRTFYNSIDKKEYTVYILRFAVTDYVCAEADVDQNKSFGDQDYYGTDNYYFEKTVFLDFNFLDMSFRDELNYIVTLPVEAKPIDIFGTITPPPSLGDDKSKFDLDRTLGGCTESFIDDPFSGLLSIISIILFSVVFILFCRFVIKLYKLFGKGKRKNSGEGGVTIFINGSNEKHYERKESSKKSSERKESSKKSSKKNSNSSQIITTGDPVLDKDLNDKYKENVKNDRSYVTKTEKKQISMKEYEDLNGGKK